MFLPQGHPGHEGPTGEKGAQVSHQEVRLGWGRGSGGRAWSQGPQRREMRTLRMWKGLSGMALTLSSSQGPPGSAGPAGYPGPRGVKVGDTGALRVGVIYQLWVQGCDAAPLETSECVERGISWSGQMSWDCGLELHSQGQPYSVLSPCHLVPENS